MTTVSDRPSRRYILAALITALSAACAPATRSAGIPPAPMIGQWPEYAFLPARQCHGRFSQEDLQQYLPLARVALWLPGTRAVALDQERRCIRVTVDGVGDGRLAELVLRGMQVPRRSILLVLRGRERRG